MKTFRWKCELSIAITVAGLLHLVEFSGGTSEFRKCYNTSVEMHCFDVQYDTTKNKWLTASFEDARQQCKNLQSTLIIIKNEETNEKLKEFMKDTDNPIKSNDVWLDAYRFNDFNVTNRWQWLNKTLPNIPASGVFYTHDANWYMAALEFNGGFYLRALQPHLSYSYVCEYRVSKCPSIDSSNVRQFDGKCYTAVNESVNWYEARNRCLKGDGDLASFTNVTNINFTSWLLSDTNVRYWIGLRFSGYIWKESGEDVKFAKWIHNGDWDPLCLAVCPTCYPSFSWHAKDCSIANSTHVVCHTATTLNPTTTLTVTTPTALTSSGSEVPQHNKPPYESSDSASSKRLAIGIGVGVGVGVPVLIAVIVLVICIVVRKRRHETLSSAQSTNRQQREAPSMKEREEVGETAYGTVVPSTFSRQAAQANGAHSATEQTVYAPLQIL